MIMMYLTNIFEELAKNMKTCIFVTFCRNNNIHIPFHFVGKNSTPKFSILKSQRMCLQGKGGGTGLWHWNMQGLGICSSQGEAHLGAYAAA